MLTNKQYECPLCKNKTTQYTNYFGEIYTLCKKCNNNQLYCIEEEAIKIRENRPQTKATILCYSFEFKTYKDWRRYETLIESIEDKGYNKFSIYCGTTTSFKQYNLIAEYEHKEITIYDKDTFENQYITEIGRLHNWAEFSYPNPNIIKGYYLHFNN